MSLRDLLRGLTPPLVKAALQRLGSRPTTYSGPYATWGAASAAADGYGHAAILERVRDATARVLRGEVDHEQDGIAFLAPAAVTPVLSGLLLAASVARGRLRVLDYGGSLGSHFLKWRRFFAPLESVQWDIVEQAGFVAAGTSLYAGSDLPVRFHAAEADLSGLRPDVLLLGSVLQYVEDPLPLLARLRDLAPNVIILDRTPLADDDVHRILVQHVSPSIYRGSYPMHVLSMQELTAVLDAAYQPVHTFSGTDAPVSGGGTRATFLGSIWLRRARDAG